MSCVSHGSDLRRRIADDIMFSQSRGEGGEAGDVGGGRKDSEAGLRGQRLSRPLDSVVQGWVR